jgi:hypothetical protein
MSEPSIERTEPIHDVRADTAGWGAHPRLTCYTCDGATLVRQPFMDEVRWQQEVAEFLRAHPPGLAILEPRGKKVPNG